VAPSVTAGLKVNVPPGVAMLVAELVDPTEKSVRVNDASSESVTVTFSVEVDGHVPFVVYSTV